MNFDKFTLKNQEAIQKAVELAKELGHQQLEPEHLAVALLHDTEGIVGSLLNRVNVSSKHLLEKLTGDLEKRPKVEMNTGVEPHVSSRLNRV